MADTSDVLITLTLQDSELDQEELEAKIQNFYPQLREIAEEVNRLPPAPAPIDEMFSPKGEGSTPGILDLKINLDSIKPLVSWLYERLVGKSTEAKIKYGEIEFEFKGNNQKDLAATMQEAERFIAAIAAVKAQNVQ